MRFIGLIFAVLAIINFNLAAPLISSEVKPSNEYGTRELLSDDVFKRDDFNSIFEEDESLAKRDVAVITEFFTALNKSGLVVPVVKILATNKITEPLLVQAIVAFLKTQNLADLLHAVDESGLAVDIVLKVLQDSTFFPGLFNIINGLRTGATTTPPKSTLDTEALTSALSPIALTYSKYSGLSSSLNSALDNLGILTSTNSGLLSALNPVLSAVGLKKGSTGSKSGASTSSSTESSAKASPTSSTKSASTSTTSTTTSSLASSLSSSLSSSSSGYLAKLLAKIKASFTKRDRVADIIKKRDNKVLDSLLESLEKSGLAMSVIDLIATDPDMAPFARDLITQIVKKQAITLDGLLLALDSTNLLNDAIIDSLSSPKLGITIN
ncbi:unnamed protein product [Debaryomyces tyrocola]|nr:unnamed protein product [Debaryomyces tyrocola]